MMISMKWKIPPVFNKSLTFLKPTSVSAFLFVKIFIYFSHTPCNICRTITVRQMLQRSKYTTLRNGNKRPDKRISRSVAENLKLK